MSNKAEVKVVVEYIIELPADIMVAKVDDYIANELDEGADSNNIKRRTVTDVAFAERPGLVDRYQALFQVVDMVETISDPSNSNGEDAKEKLDTIFPLVSNALDQVEEEEEEE
jgi:hypothetical protein